MSSTERAPEPTMEEILASIRRIISDDEAAPSPRATSRSQAEDESLELVEEEADDKIIDDIARVLSGGQESAAESGEIGEEDILDLTAELGGLEPVDIDEEPLPLEAEAASEPDADFEADEPVVDLEVVALEFIEDEPVQQLESEPEQLEREVQAAPVQPEPEPESAPEPTPPPEPAKPMSASEEAASALERAIAALRAGQVPTSAPQYGMQTPAPPPIFTPTPMPEYRPEPQPVPQAAPVFSMPAPQPEPAPEPRPVLTVTEFIEQTVIVTEEASSGPEQATFEQVAFEEAAPEPAAETEASFWPPSEPARAVKTNGSTPHEHHADEASIPVGGSAKTLEDSVKDMLRPMLKQWLEENMTRVLTAALQDEIRSDPARFERN